jgi:hypothetical protein
MIGAVIAARRITALALIALGMIGLAGCGAMTPADQTRFGVDSVRIQAKIETLCLGSGLFKAADGAVAMFVPAANLPVALVNAGVDRVCAHPAAFAQDASTVEWLARNLAARL